MGNPVPITTDYDATIRNVVMHVFPGTRHGLNVLQEFDEGYVEEAAEGVNNSEKEHKNVDNEGKVGSVERGFVVQCSLLVDIPENDKRSSEDEITEVCLMEVVRSEHMVGDYRLMQEKLLFLWTEKVLVM
ncbi:unnamed protein product [Amaranthus hypochondriacus]